MKFGLIGFGEVGSRFAEELRAAGADVSVHVRHPEAVRQRAGELGVALSSELTDADMLISAVWVSAAEEVASARVTGKPYIDVTNVGIEATRRMSALPGFHKGAILAPVARHGAKSPMLLAGPQAQELAELLNAHGLNVRAVGPKPEQAAAIKILRSVATKCIVALLHDMTHAADAYGVNDQVLESAGEFFASEPFPDLARTLLKQSDIHAERLAGEMDEIVEALRTAGCSDRVPELARQVFQEIARQNQAVRK
jgi:3-hydroxyisobutyrate dehydrogenase-like beta-hydroxyacid dehydrogenase